MEVVLTVGRAALGMMWHPGDTIDVPEAEARRLIAAGSAEVPPPPAVAERQADAGAAPPREVVPPSPRKAKHARASD